MHSAVGESLEAEREPVDLAWVLHKRLALLVYEHVVGFVWLSCHLLRLGAETINVIIA